MRRAFIILSLFSGLAYAQDPPRPDPDMSGRRELGMASCPSAVPGAQTRITDVEGGVALEVTARDAWAQQEIRRRARKQLEVADLDVRGAIEHTGLGTGSGRFGHCPGMVMHTDLQVTWLPDGARFTIVAGEGTSVEALRRSTRDRASALRRALRPR